MISTTLTAWQLTTHESVTVMNVTATQIMCASQAAFAIKVYFRGLCLDGDDGP
jgi:hypothetical protein